MEKSTVPDVFVTKEEILAKALMLAVDGEECPYNHGYDCPASPSACEYDSSTIKSCWVRYWIDKATDTLVYAAREKEME